MASRDSVELSFLEEASQGEGRDFSVLSTVSITLSFIPSHLLLPKILCSVTGLDELKGRTQPWSRSDRPNLQRLKVAQLSEQDAFGSGPWSSFLEEHESEAAFLPSL